MEYKIPFFHSPFMFLFRNTRRFSVFHPQPLLISAISSTLFHLPPQLCSICLLSFVPSASSALFHLPLQLCSIRLFCFVPSASSGLFHLPPQHPSIRFLSGLILRYEFSGDLFPSLEMIGVIGYCAHIL